MGETKLNIAEGFQPGDETARRERLREIMDAYLRGRIASGSGSAQP